MSVNSNGMRLTHFGHSCLLAEFSAGGNSTTLLFDPGDFSHGFESITGLSAILVTHQHPDHIDMTRLPALIKRNPGAALYADPMTAGQLGERWNPVHPGDSFSVGELRVRGVGGQHAVVHPELPRIDNTSYLVGDTDHPARLMYPGDALFVPDEDIDVLALPTAAPWLKISEAVEYLRAVRPRRAVPVHQGSLRPEVCPLYYTRFREMADADFQVLPHEVAVEF